MKKLINFKNFINPIWRENPVFYLMLGLCPLLAVSGSVRDSLGMGIAVIFVLVGSNFTVSLIRRFVPSHVRIPVFIVVIATFVTIADYSIAAFSPEIHRNLGRSCNVAARTASFFLRTVVARMAVAAGKQGQTAGKARFAPRPVSASLLFCFSGWADGRGIGLFH